MEIFAILLNASSLFFVFGLFSNKLPLARSTDTDHFVSHLCKERRYRMDWKAIRKPCEGKMNFSTHIYSKKRTKAELTIVTRKDIRASWEYSSFSLKTFDHSGLAKSIGGDTWRVFVKGPSALEALVYDLNNGTYEVSFLLLEPGNYNVTAYLQGSLCSSYVNPPSDWFKKGDYNGHFQSEKLYNQNSMWPFLIREQMWKPMKPFEFVVKKGNTQRKKKNKEHLDNWQNICDLSLNCNFLFDGFGEWYSENWEPDINKSPAIPRSQNLKPRRKQGTLWLYGDCYAFHLFENIWNGTLCNKQFETCGHSYNWVYPRWNPDAKKDKSLHWQRHFDINISWLIKYFKAVLEKRELNKTHSAMLLNLGLHYIRSTSFANYRKIINGYIKEIKNHRIDVVWRTTTSIYIPECKAHKRFQTYQRALLFNAYSMTAMCQAGIPIIDVFPMTSSYPHQPGDGIHFDVKLLKPVVDVLESYFHYL